MRRKAAARSLITLAIWYALEASGFAVIVDPDPTYVLGVILADRSRPEKGTVLADAPMLLAIVDEGDLFFDYEDCLALVLLCARNVLMRGAVLHCSACVLLLNGCSYLFKQVPSTAQ